MSKSSQSVRTMNSSRNCQFSVKEDATNYGERRKLVRKHRITITILCLVFLVGVLAVIFYYEWTVKPCPNNSLVLVNKVHQTLSSESTLNGLEYATTSAIREMSSKQGVLSSIRASSTVPTRAPSDASTRASSDAPIQVQFAALIRAPSTAPTQASSTGPTRAPSNTSILASSTGPTRAPSNTSILASSTAPTLASSTAPARASSTYPARAPSTAPNRASSTDLNTLSVRHLPQSATETTRQSQLTGDTIGFNDSATEESVTNLKQIPKLQLTNFTLTAGQKYYVLSEARGEAMATLYTPSSVVLSGILEGEYWQEFRLKSTGVANHYTILVLNDHKLTYHDAYRYKKAKFEKEKRAGLEQQWIVEPDRGNAFVIKSAFNPELCFIDGRAVRTGNYLNNVRRCDDYPDARGWIFLKICDLQ